VWLKRVFRNPLAWYITTTQCYINLAARWGCHAIWCWRDFEGVVNLSLVLTASGFGYLENRGFELTPRNVTAPGRWDYHAIPLRANICVRGGWITASPQAHATERE